MTETEKERYCYTFIYSSYVEKVTEMIIDKYGINPKEALRRFLQSETYQMLIDPELEMCEFSPLGIFDLWENEQVTGNPRNSLYLRCV